jgi:hypothetical protein
MNVENRGIERARWREQDDGDDGSTERPIRSFEPLPGVDEHAQRLVLAFVANQKRTAPDNDDVAFIALTGGAEKEALAVARVTRGQVTIVHERGDGTVGAAGTKLDLTNRDDIDRFTASLNVPLEVKLAVADAIWTTPLEGRHELAELAKLWAPAEAGATSPSRLVLSGHASGEVVHGNRAALPLSSIARLAEAIPSAAARVEDVLIDACFQGRPGTLEKLVRVFPNLKTAHGYADFAPEGDVEGARRWEAGTRGRAETRVGLHPKGSAWTRRGGYSIKEVPVNVARAELARRDVFDRYFRGDAHDSSAFAGPLTEYHAALQRLIANPDLPPGDRGELVARSDQTVLLRHYREVARCFVLDHRVAIGAGYAALGAPLPDLALLDRREALRAIADVERRAASMPDAPPAARELVHLLGLLRDLPQTREIRYR